MSLLISSVEKTSRSISNQKFIEVKMETAIVKRGGKDIVTLTQGVQTFTIGYEGTKAEARWMKRMLNKALKNYKKLLLER